jgi:8-oxo-dGTP pyrophosphatase MutT (NUDIX family)
MYSRVKHRRRDPSVYVGRMPTQYVAGFLFHPQLQRVALIRKARPQWMAGKLNAIGGHIEPGEDSLKAMIREFKEEAGLSISYWKRFAVLSGANNGGWSVDWFWARIDYEVELQSKTDEVVAWYGIQHIPGTWSVVANLPWLLLMALNDMQEKDACSLFRIEEAERY